MKTSLEQAKEIIQIYTKKRAEMDAGRDWMDGFIEIYKSIHDNCQERQDYSRCNDEIFFVLRRIFIREKDSSFEISQQGRILPWLKVKQEKSNIFTFSPTTNQQNIAPN